MTTLHKKSLKSLAVCATTLFSMGAVSSPVLSQAAAPNSEARFSVDIKDANLLDALELVFIAAGNPSRNIDASARSVKLGTVSFKNQPWRDIVRTLTSLNKFKFSKRDGVWLVEPRLNNTSTSTVFESSTRIAAKVVDFKVETRANAQNSSSSSSGSGGNGSDAGTVIIRVLPAPAVNQSNNPWTVIEPNHTYAGALALLFQGSTFFGTQEMVVPSSAYVPRLTGYLAFYNTARLEIFETPDNNNSNNR